MRQRTPIGGLLLETVEGWSFSLRDDTIAGRRGSQPGVLRLTTQAANLLPSPLTHDWCLKTAARFAQVLEPALRSQQTVFSATGPFGWGSGRFGKDYVCAWYCNRPPGLILGVYAIPLSLYEKSEQQEALNEAAHIVASAVFDRPSWGGDEPLTRWLVAQLDADWRSHLPEDGPEAEAGQEQQAPSENPQKIRSDSKSEAH